MENKDKILEIKANSRVCVSWDFGQGEHQEKNILFVGVTGNKAHFDCENFHREFYCIPINKIISIEQL